MMGGGALTKKIAWETEEICMIGECPLAQL